MNGWPNKSTWQILVVFHAVGNVSIKRGRWNKCEPLPVVRLLLVDAEVAKFHNGTLLLIPASLLSIHLCQHRASHPFGATLQFSSGATCWPTLISSPREST